MQVPLDGVRGYNTLLCGKLVCHLRTASTKASAGHVLVTNVLQTVKVTTQAVTNNYFGEPYIPRGSYLL
jgi:chitinase